jgi:hypothetical protein
MIKLMNIANYLQIQNSSLNWVDFSLNLTISLSLFTIDDHWWVSVCISLNCSIYNSPPFSDIGSLIYIGFNQLIHSILIGWLPLGWIANLYASLPFIPLQSTDEMELCLLLNCNNRFCYSLWLCRNLFDSNSTHASMGEQAPSSTDRI